MSATRPHSSARDREPRTAWLPATSRPARPGVYERRAPAGPFACWDGERWRRDAATPAAAAGAGDASERQGAAWRGLAEPPSSPCATCRGHTVIDHGLDAERDEDRIAECPDC